MILFGLLEKLSLFIWILMGLGLRFFNLGNKPPWGDEWCTLIFGLGHGYRNIPLDQRISLDVLLQPLVVDRRWMPGQVVEHLLHESNHPPLYFLLTHSWLHLFSADQGWVSLVAGRSLSALMGTLAIPLVFWLVRSLTRSALSATIAAALMAVSPFGVYLAQEARHYTLSIVWILLLLSFVNNGLRTLQHRVPLPWWQVWLWIGLNGLGLATHFFYLLALGAASFVFLGIWLQHGLTILLARVNIVLGWQSLPQGVSSLRKIQPLNAGTDLEINSEKGTGILAQNTMDSGTSQPFWQEVEPFGLSTIEVEQVLKHIAHYRLRHSLRVMGSQPWQRLYWVAIGTLITALVWLTRWRNIADTPLTHWLERDRLSDLESGWQVLLWLVEPIGRLLGWIATMTFLLPLEGVPTPVVIFSATVLFVAFIGLLVLVYQQVKRLLHQPARRSMTQLLLGFVGGAIGLFGVIIYGFGTDLTLAPRYHFVYFPGCLILLSLVLAQIWQGYLPIGLFRNRMVLSGKMVVGAIVLLGLIGSLSVVTNVAYQKPDQADRMVQQFLRIQQEEQGPENLLIAIAHRSHGETGKLMSIGWELREPSPQVSVDPGMQFLLAHWDDDANVATQTLHRALIESPRPLSLWLINFSMSHGVEPFGCELAPQFRPNAPGYWSRLYYCK